MKKEGFMDKVIFKTMRKAIKEGDIDIVKEILENDNTLVNEDTPFGTWLHMAAEQDNISISKYLISKGADVNKNSGMAGGNALRSAARKGNIKTVEFLYNNGSMFDVSSSSKNPLFAAICSGHMEIVKFLVKNGIDLDAAYDIGSLKNVDAIEYARQYGQTEIKNYLIEAQKQKS